MQFLRTLFWVLVTTIVVVFTMHNWRSVPVDLFGGLQADVKLPVLLLIAFLIGFVPLYIYYRAALWRAERAASRPVEPVGTPAVAIDPASPPAVPAMGSAMVPDDLPR